MKIVVVFRRYRIVINVSRKNDEDGQSARDRPLTCAVSIPFADTVVVQAIEGMKERSLAMNSLSLGR